MTFPPVVPSALAALLLMMPLRGLAEGPGRGPSVTLPEDASAVTLEWPITGTPSLNSPFGPRRLGSQDARYDWHRGLDLRLPIGTPLYAPADAYVVHAGSHPGFADTIVQLRHNSEEPYLYTLYLHLSDVEVTAGETISAGTLIAQSGQGSATYPHLHWEVRFGCLFQRCCENPYSYLNVGNNPPAAPALTAFGTSSALGNTVLVSTTFPKTEIDFQMIEVAWGADTITAELNLYNALTGTEPAGLLDDPLFFHEEEGRSVVFIPGRYNDTFASADYEILFFNLDDATFTGSATVGDGGGLTAQTTLSPNPPPVSVVSLNELILTEPGSTVTSSFQVTNLDGMTHQVDFRAISAQSLDPDVSPESAMLGPGESVTVEIDVTLDASFPEDVGDILLLLADVDSGAFTEQLGVSLVETSESAGIGDWFVLK